MSRPLLVYSFSLLCLLSPLSGQIVVNTFAGGAIPSGIAAQNAYLASAAGLTWDLHGNLVFCDSVNNVIRRVNSNGTIETIAGTGTAGFSGDGGPALASQLFSPVSPRFDVYGNLYFVDQMNYRIRRIDANGVITTIAGNGLLFVPGMDRSGPAATTPLDHVTDLAADNSGNVYFAEPDENMIRRVTPSGQVQVVAGAPSGCSSCTSGDGGPATSAELSEPEYVAVDPSGNLFFTDQTFTEIRKVSPQGIISTFLGPVLSPSSRGIAIPFSFMNLAADASGNIYAITSAYSSGAAIVRFDPNANPSVVAGGMNGPNPSADGPALPSNIAPSWLTVDGHGNIAFSDEFAVPYNAILELREVTAQSALVTLAGANPQPAPDGTPLDKAWFFSPSSIAFDPSGNLYIADFQACQIRKINTAGVLSTFAGSGKCGYPAPSGNAKTADLVYPSSIAVDSKSNVWVADDFLNLYSIAQDGTISFFPTRTPVTGGKGWLAFDSQDRLYVGGVGSLVRILPDLTTQTIVASATGPSAPPPGLVNQVDGLGNGPSGVVYFASGSNLYVINADGTYTQVARNPWGASSDSLSPAFAVDKAGNFWQPSFASIAVTSPSGTALLGAGKTGASGDAGPAVSAGFNSGAAAFSPSGDLYIIDGNRIRVITGSSPSQPPAIAQGGIVNSASYSGGAIAPGELLSIFGSNFGASTLATNAPVNNSIPTALGRTRVLFNGQPGAITAVSPNQINVFVPPYNPPPSSPVQIQIQVDDVLSQPVSVPVVDAAPGLFTALGTGSGQGSILNQDGSVNSAANPAAPGSIISIFGTGEGAINTPYGLGFLVLSTPYPAMLDSVSVNIAGQPAITKYAGEAPTLPTGVFQINAQIPAGITGNSVPVSVSIGTHTAGNQVTVAVR